MNGKKLLLLALVAICSLAFAGEASARGGAWGGGRGAGIRLQKRDGTCVRYQAASPGRTGQRMRDGTGMYGAGARRGTGPGAMRTLGPGDGTGNAPRPMDGTGYGSPVR